MQGPSRIPEVVIALDHSSADHQQEQKANHKTEGAEEVPDRSWWSKLSRATLDHFHAVFSQSMVTAEVLKQAYAGEGTEESPYVVDFLPQDPRNPKAFSGVQKWSITILMAFATLAVAFASSAYTGGAKQVISDLNTNEEVFTLGISLFVLGFAVGPLLWAPLSELYGRQILFFITYAAFTAFNAGAAGATNIETLLVLRFFAGAFGSSSLTNAGGVIADMFTATERGLAISVFAAAPFLGPVIGPIVGGFVGETIGWRWVEGIMAIFTGSLWIICSLLVPETYAPVLLRRRAAALSKKASKMRRGGCIDDDNNNNNNNVERQQEATAVKVVYRSKFDIDRGGKPSVLRAFRTALSRPLLLLFLEPIVLLLSIYIAIIYGTLYMMFAAFPIVFQVDRGWSEGIGGLAFIGMAVGILSAVIYTLFDDIRYRRTEKAHREKGEPGAPPEARLPPCMVGAVFIPAGLFWFAWTNYPSIFWLVCIIATVPFGFGLVLVFLSVQNYLIDAYTIYAASVLAANTVLRSLCGMAFPLFTTYMYNGLGIHWASSVPAFLALACVPFPFLFWKLGPRIRAKCKYSREAQEAAR